MESSTALAKTIGIALLATTVVVATVSALVLAIDFVLLIFLAVLFGIFLTKTSLLVRNRTPLGYGWSLGVVTTLLIVAISGTILIFGVNIEDQLNKTSQQLDKSSEKIHRWLDEHPLALNAVRKVPFANQVFDSMDSPDSGNRKIGKHVTQKFVDQSESQKDGSDKSEPHNELAANSAADNEPNDSSGQRKDQNTSEKSVAESASRQTDASNEETQMATSMAGKAFAVFGKMLSTTFGAIANIGIVFFIGIFIAVNPTHYRDGVVYLFPKGKRDRVTEVLNLVGDSMFNWLNGRFLAMLITGAGTWIALMVLGVPMAFTVGVITGLLTFIPNIGGLIALGLASLLALTQGPMTVVWVVVIYSVLQLIESNIITPLVQQHQTSIPPALLLGFQIVMGALTGFLGIMVSTPLLAGLMVLVKQLWIKDTLEDDSFEDDEDSDDTSQSNESREERETELVSA